MPGRACPAPRTVVPARMTRMFMRHAGFGSWHGPCFFPVWTPTLLEESMRVQALFAAGLLGLAPAANAQVSGTIIIGGGPIGGVITVGQPVIVARPRARVVYADPRVVYVERWHGNGHVKHGHGYSRRVVYYDPRDRVYYDRHRGGCREVEVWEREGRYYRDGDRYDDRYDDRHDDRYDDRRYDQRRHR